MTPEQAIQRAAERRGRRAFGGFVAVAAIVSVTLGFFAAGTSFGALADRMGRHDGCDGCQSAGPGAEVLREGRRVALIRQVAAPSAVRRYLLLLAPASGAVIDSARSGLLVGRVEARAAPDAWRVALVSQAAVRGLSAMGALVLVSGEPPIPVYGRTDARP